MCINQGEGGGVKKYGFQMASNVQRCDMFSFRNADVKDQEVHHFSKYQCNTQKENFLSFPVYKRISK